VAVGQEHHAVYPWERYPSPDGVFSRSDFIYDAERDVYVCANGRLLRTSGTVHDGRVRNYLSQPQDCRACTLKQRCTRAPFKKIARDINEDARSCCGDQVSELRLGSQVVIGPLAHFFFNRKLP